LEESEFSTVLQDYLVGRDPNAASYHIVEFRHGLKRVSHRHRYPVFADAVRDADEWERVHPDSRAFISSYFHEPFEKPSWNSGRLLSVAVLLIGTWRICARSLDVSGLFWFVPALATLIVYQIAIRLWPVKGETTILTERAKSVPYFGVPELRRITRADFIHKSGRSAEDQQMICAAIALLILILSLYP